MKFMSNSTQTIWEFLSGTALGNLLLLLIAIALVLSWLFRSFSSRPSIEAHLQSVSDSSTVIPDAKTAGSTPTYRLPADLMKGERTKKSQGITVRAHGRMIRRCKARLKVGDLYIRHLYWTHLRAIDGSPDRKYDEGSITADLTPEKDFVLTLWYADKTENETIFNLSLNVEPAHILRIDNTRSTPRNLPLELTFIYEDGEVNMKPYCFVLDLNSWESLGAKYRAA